MNPPLASATSALVGAGRRLACSTWVLGCIIAVFSFRPWILLPGVGLDPSWQASLHLAAREGLDFGRQVNFTYGPLGFLSVPTLYFSSTWALAIFFSAAVQIGICLFLVRSSRFALGLPLGFICSLIAARFLLVLEPAEVGSLLLLAMALAVLQRSTEQASGSGTIVALGVLAALLLLVKFNSGALALVLMVILVSQAPSGCWRWLVALGGAFVAGGTVLWVGAGNALGDLPSWLSSSVHIARAYSSAMAIEISERSGDYPLLLLSLVILGIMAWFAMEPWPLSRRLAIGAMLTIFTFAAFKRGFVRHDEHAFGFFAALPAVAILLRGRTRPTLLGFGALAAIFLVVTPFAASTLFDPGPSVTSVRSGIAHLLSPSRRGDLITQGRLAQRAVYALDDATLAALRGKTVHVDPWETSIIWAYPELRWQPLPAFQSYVAYDAAIDRQNAGALSSSDAPQRILRETPRAIDSRNPDFESPEAVKAMICNYRQLLANDKWQVLAKVRDRCGRPRHVASVKARLDTEVKVPAAGPDELMFARIDGLEGGLLQQAASMVYKAAETYMITADGSRFRIVPATATGPLLMRAPPLGQDPIFGPTTTVRAFRIAQHRGLRVGSVEIEFFAVPVV